MQHLPALPFGMLPYLHILIRAEDDGSLHALAAFSSKEKETAYIDSSGLTESQLRRDCYNGPFDKTTQVIYAGHRNWNMDRFQLAGYFTSEAEAWSAITQEGYVNRLQIDSTFQEAQLLKQEALAAYKKKQKR